MRGLIEGMEKRPGEVTLPGYPMGMDTLLEVTVVNDLSCKLILGLEDLNNLGLFKRKSTDSLICMKNTETKHPTSIFTSQNLNYSIIMR